MMVRNSRETDADDLARETAPEGESARATRGPRRAPARAAVVDEPPLDDALLARLDRADELAAAGSPAEAAEAYSAVLAASPDYVRAVTGLGAALAAQRKFDAAEKELRRAQRLAPDSFEVHLQLGTALYKKGVYAAAATALRRAVELDGSSVAAYLILGEALNQMAESDAAIEALEEVARLQPDNSRAYYAMGIAYDRKGNPERAAEMYRLSREHTNK
jgi:tetratricopeptide (TPR) repeat protein